MKIAANIAGALLGAIFLFASISYFFKLVPMPPPPEGSPPALFMGALGPTGYLDFIKTCELIGAILVAIPLTRNIGLLFLGPIILNILAFHIFITKWAGLMEPMTLGVVVLGAFLLWVGRKKFAGLLNRRAEA
jgi:putative oxidoreductase